MTRVLVIDDQKIPRVTVGAMLHDAGYEVAAEPGGPEGIARAVAWSPDVIVLDVQMPGMDGFQVVERLKQDPRTAPVPVIFLTAEPPREDLVVRGLEMGAYDFLNKGCSRAELLARVGAMTRVKRGYDEMAAVARLSEILVGSLDPAELAAGVVAEVARTFRADAAVLVRPGDSGAADVVAVHDGDPGGGRLRDTARELLDRTRSRGGGAGALADDAASLACGGSDFGAARFARVDHGRAFPLLLGVLCRDPAGLGGDSSFALLDLLARQAALALDAAALHQQILAQAATLQEQAGALEQAMDDRSRFFASMSHELRTPINAVLGYTSLLAEGVYGAMPPPQRAAVERVVASGRHLLQIVNDVLDLAKIDAGKLEIAPEAVDLGPLVRETVGSVEVQARAKGLEVHVDAGPPQRLVTDPGRVTQILLNLLSNAVKFTDSGSVSIAACAAGPWAEVRVSDTGPGITEQERAAVFSEFEQTATATGRGGTGLGLAISRRLAVLLGGTLELESASGQGSTFLLRLPVTPADGDEPPAVAASGGGMTVDA
jgi:signal transduction histidine kinase/FixJ family two-component response regulator